MASKASTAYVAFLWAALARKEKGQLNDLFPLLAMIHEVPTAMTRVSFTTTQWRVPWKASAFAEVCVYTGECTRL